MAKKKKPKHSEGKFVGYGEYDPTSPESSCIFCSSHGRYWVEYDCGVIQHRHPQVPTCKSCAWLLSQTSGGQYTIHTKAFDGREELAQMKVDALEAVEEILEQGRAHGTGHENAHLKKSPPRLDRDIWHG